MFLYIVRIVVTVEEFFYETQRETLGLKWQRLKAQPEGDELEASQLEAELKKRNDLPNGEITFTKERWLEFGVTGLRGDHFIRSDGAYFKPALSENI